VKSGETTTITKRLQAGYDINLADNRDLTPLHHATCHIGDELVQFLLRNGAQIDLGATGVGTALDYACEQQNFRSAIALVEAGAYVHPNALCSCVRGIHVSSKEGLASDRMRELERLQEQLAQKLVTELSVSGFRPRCHGSTPLLCAVSNDDLPAMRLLLSLGVDVNAPDHKGITPLMMAVEKSNLDHVSVLLAAGADPNRYSHRGESAFCFVEPNNRMSGILKLLLEHGIDIPNCAEGVSHFLSSRAHRLF
jgi:ankyrin repeat protein